MTPTEMVLTWSNPYVPLQRCIVGKMEEHIEGNKKQVSRHMKLHRNWIKNKYIESCQLNWMQSLIAFMYFYNMHWYTYQRNIEHNRPNKWKLCHVFIEDAQLEKKKILMSGNNDNNQFTPFELLMNKFSIWPYFFFSSTDLIAVRDGKPGDWII